MDPIHLNSEELDYELMVRAKLRELDVNNRSKTRILSELLRSEKQGDLKRPSIGASPFTPEQDVQMCQQICRELQDDMNKSQFDLYEKQKICSRAIHVGDRLQRVDKSKLSAASVEILSECFETMRTTYAQFPPMVASNQARKSDQRQNVSFAEQQSQNVSTETNQISNAQLQSLVHEVDNLNRARPTGAIPRTPVSQTYRPLMRVHIPFAVIPDQVMSDLNQNRNADFHQSGASIINIGDESENAQAGHMITMRSELIRISILVQTIQRQQPALRTDFLWPALSALFVLKDRPRSSPSRSSIPTIH